MPTYLSQVSIFDSMLALVVLVAVNWAFTLIHILQEWKGEAVPLWRVFGAVGGVRLPNWLGFLSFTLGLCVLQWLVGLAAIAGWLPLAGSLQPSTGVLALGAIVGARLGDSVVSHWTLYRLGYRPNPGLSSTVLYCAEAIFILVAFRTGLAHEPTAAWIGFACGAGFFLAVLPLLALLHVIVPPWR